MLIEYRIIASIIYKIRNICTSKFQPKLNDAIDSDVLDEKYRVQAMSKIEIESHSLVLKNMVKMYGPFLAVNELSVGVDP